MAGVSTNKEQPSIEEMTTAEGHVPSAGHDMWVREIVGRRLADKKAGKIAFRSLEEVVAEFGVGASSLL